VGNETPWHTKIFNVTAKNYKSDIVKLTVAFDHCVEIISTYRNVFYNPCILEKIMPECSCRK
jgi:hypothetical protein